MSGVETPVWTFLGPRPANWWIRRRLHETAVHRADAAHRARDSTSRSRPTWRPTGSANGSSGSRSRPGATDAPLPLEDGDTLHLHATDPGLGEAGEWTDPRRRGAGITWSHEHGKRQRGAARRRHRAAAGAWSRRVRSPTPTSRCSATTQCGRTGWTARRFLAAPHGTFQTMTTSEIATVLAWHDALNASDIDTLVALSSDDIEIGDAHGAAQGHEALRRLGLLPPDATPNSARCTCTTASWSSNRRSAAQAIRRQHRVGIPGGPRPRHLGVPSRRPGVGAGGDRTHRGRPRRLRQ